MTTTAARVQLSPTPLAAVLRRRCLLRPARLLKVFFRDFSPPRLFVGGEAKLCAPAAKPAQGSTSAPDHPFTGLPELLPHALACWLPVINLKEQLNDPRR